METLECAAKCAPAGAPPKKENHPMLRLMRYERYGAPAFVFDMMEPERPKVDRAVLAFLGRRRCIRLTLRSAMMGL